MKQLIEEAKNGNIKAFTILIENIQNYLYRIAKTRLSNDFDIDDAIQETIIIVYKQINNLKDNSKFKGWIFKILINECKKIYIGELKKQIIIEKYILNSKDLKKEDMIKERIDKIDFNLIIKRLKPDEKEIASLYYRNMLHCREIGQLLNMNTNTVKSKLFRIRKKMKKILNGNL